jgi:hypothetical protein
VAKRPRYPVLIGEVCYEGEYGSNWEDLQRFFFWTSMLSGSCGHTYGANGVWQMNSPDAYFVGIRTYGDAGWAETMHLPGSRQLGLAKRFLERYPWHDFAPVVQARRYETDRISPFMAGVPGKVWMIYLAGEALDRKFWGLMGADIAIEPDTTYRAFFFNPRDGSETDLGPVVPDAEGRWPVPQKPTREDMILVLEATVE